MDIISQIQFPSFGNEAKTCSPCLIYLFSYWFGELSIVIQYYP